MAGEPVQIAFLENSRIKISVDNFAAILRQVGDHPVCIVSINGLIRSGKSYMMGHFRRYLASSDRSNGHWFHQTHTREFQWKSSADLQTKGIMMWSKPYFVRNDRRKIGVLLMDTQGCFDPQLTTDQNSFIISLSCLFSSVLIHNVRHEAVENGLRSLLPFVEYSMLAQDSSKLILLIRDWEIPDYACGYHSDEYTSGPSGQNYKTERVNIQPNMPDDVKKVHEAILSSFTSVECYLLPHPGQTFSRKGEPGSVEPQFVVCVKDFVLRVLGADSIVTKTIYGQEVTGVQLLEFVKEWSKLFETCELLQARNVAEAAAMVRLGNARKFAIDRYTSLMNTATDEDMLAEMLEGRHQEAQREAEQKFNEMKAIRHEAAEKRILESLRTEMEISYPLYKQIHTCKQELRECRTEIEELRQPQREQDEKMQIDYNRVLQ